MENVSVVKTNALTHEMGALQPRFGWFSNEEAHTLVGTGATCGGWTCRTLRRRPADTTDRGISIRHGLLTLVETMSVCVPPNQSDRHTAFGCPNDAQTSPAHVVSRNVTAFAHLDIQVHTADAVGPIHKHLVGGGRDT